MTTIPVGALPTSAAATSSSATSSSASTGSDTLDTDTFLRLLVAQLKYQDPSKPTDSSQFLAQTAQFTLVEKMQALASSQAELVKTSALSSATSLVGSRITYLQSGVTSTGTVTGVSISDGVPTLMVGSTKVDLSEISKVESASG
jgi:flagellar basal-body rod modification protein FlgD